MYIVTTKNSRYKGPKRNRFPLMQQQSSSSNVWRFQKKSNGNQSDYCENATKADPPPTPPPPPTVTVRVTHSPSPAAQVQPFVSFPQLERRGEHPSHFHPHPSHLFVHIHTHHTPYHHHHPPHPSKGLSSMRHFENQSSCLPTFYLLSYLPTYLHRPPSFYLREGSP